MTPDQHRDAAQRASARRVTLLFIGITVLMAGLTLGLPYLIHLLRPATVQGRPESLQSAASPQ